ncbi:serine/threonine protein kinase [Striga asiatica]|uniref:Serine/threonine protein kinase n=1 Tax=Striga asiatica TaxID=4170 RepID=A0A5A7PP23_STRAF|nr:serine/threonine protein kinase [Striga asiatica]
MYDVQEQLTQPELFFSEQRYSLPAHQLPMLDCVDDDGGKLRSDLATGGGRCPHIRHHTQHRILRNLPQLIKLREHHFPKVRPILPPELRTLQRQLCQQQGLLDWPVGHRWVEHLPKSLALNGPLHMENNPERVNVRFNPEHARLLVLRVDVAESASCRGHSVLGDVIGHGRRDEARQADVADLADVVSVEEDVGWLEVTVDEGLGLGLVEEEKASADLCCDTEPVLPGQWRGVAVHEETVLQAAVGHVFVDEAAVFGAGAQKEDHVRYLLLKLRSPLSSIGPEDLHRDRTTSISSIVYFLYRVSDCANELNILVFSSASFRAFISALIRFWASSSASLWAASACSRAALDLAFSFSARASAASSANRASSSLFCSSIFQRWSSIAYNIREKNN